MRNGGRWTEAKWRSFIVSLLRSGQRRWPPKQEAVKSAKVGKQINEATGRLADHYRCAACGNVFPLKQVQADHIEPVIDPAVGFVDWGTYITRMFCEKDNYQILCKDCHKAKTAKERQTAKERKANEA